MILRALSAIAVVFCHLPFQANNFFFLPENDWLNAFFNPFGYIPVLIFFSLSGYLVSLGFLTQRHDAYSIKGVVRYYRSRILRIIPLYYFSIIFCVFVFWAAAEHNTWRVLKLFVFVENYRPMNGIVFNHVYWTMPIEMLYFFFAPLAFVIIKWVAKRYGDLLCLFLILMLWLLVSYYAFYGFDKNAEGFVASRREWNYHARFDFLYNLAAFLLGSIGAVIVNNPEYEAFFKRYRHWVKALVSVFCISIIIYCSLIGLKQMANGLVNYFNAYLLIPSMALVVIGCAIINTTQRKSKEGRSSVIRLFEHLGVLSYGIYLFHMPIFEVVQRLLSAYQVTLVNEWLTLLVLLLTIGFSQLTYRYVEQPFLRRR